MAMLTVGRPSKKRWVGWGILLAGCVGLTALATEKPEPVRLADGRKFASIEALIEHLRAQAMKEVKGIEQGHFYGDSLMINLPPDGMIPTPGFLGYELAATPQGTRVIVEQYKLAAEVAMAGLVKAALFDSITLKQSSSYKHQAATLGYRYVLNIKKGHEIVLVDTQTNKEEVIWQGAPGAEWRLVELVHQLERALEEGEAQPRGAVAGVLEKAPPIEGMQYDDATRRGWVSIKGRGLEARSLVLRRIAEICATKNKLLVSDDMASRGAFKVLDEELKEGVLRISFEALY